MNDFLRNLDTTNCAFVGEGVVFKGSIAATGKLVILGTVEGQVEAGELLVGTNGTVKGNVRVDYADIQGMILENVEAKVCLQLRQTGRIEGTAVYGEIEIEKGGMLIGRVSERSAGENEGLKAPAVSVAEIRSGIAGSKNEGKAASVS
jgi:cytoskeletal protein CcmA (bactofilin family)